MNLTKEIPHSYDEIPFTIQKEKYNPSEDYSDFQEFSNKNEIPTKKPEKKQFFAALKAKPMESNMEKKDLAVNKPRKDWNSRIAAQKVTQSSKNDPKYLPKPLENPIISNITTKLSKIPENSSNSDKNALNLNFDKVKDFYISFDSGKMTSTIVNLDIEEMCFCLANVILKYLEFGIKYNSEINEEEDRYQSEVSKMDQEYYTKLEMKKPAVKKSNRSNHSRDEFTSNEEFSDYSDKKDNPPSFWFLDKFRMGRTIWK